MKRVCLLGLLCALGFVASGCVAVSAKNNRFASRLDAVTVGNQIYVVNTRTGEYAKIDPNDSAKCVSLARLSDDDDCDLCDKD
jgi:hypothetical protein